MVLAMMRFGQQSEVGLLREVLVADPRELYFDEDKLNAEWHLLNFTSKPDRDILFAEFESLVSTLEKYGANVKRVVPPAELSLDAIYVRDSSIVLPDGSVIICHMGKANRRTESDFIHRYYRQIGVRIAGQIEPPGMMEGGDVITLNKKTLLVGRSYRTNPNGIEQLRRLVPDSVEHVMSIPLPHFRGPGDVLHLMSLISPLDERTLLVHLEPLPIEFVEWLRRKDYRLIEIESDEYNSLACNVLSLGDRRCLMVEGNPVTASRLRDASFEVFEVAGAELCLKGCGGPTCLTRPLLRCE